MGTKDTNTTTKLHGTGCCAPTPLGTPRLPEPVYDVEGLPCVERDQSDVKGSPGGEEIKPLVASEVQSVDGEHPEDEAGIPDDDVRNGEKDDWHLLQDKGWAWFVCLGCFYSHFITGGFERSDGVMFLEFTDKFQQGAQLTAWPAAICSTLRLCMGPAATAVCNRFSARTAVMIGSFIFAIGVIISGFAPNVIFLFFSYGILQGVGRGLVYAPSLIIVGLYFNRRRALGTGLGSAGVGAGTFIFPPLLEWLFHEFGFQGAFLIMGGLVLNFCIVAALYRPVFVHRSIVLRTRAPQSSREEEESLASPVNSSKKEPLVTHIPEVKDQSCAGSCDKKRSTESVPTATAASKRSATAALLKTMLSTCFPTEKHTKDSPKQKLIEWSLLKDLPFLFFCFSICIFSASFKSAFTFLPPLARTKGIPITGTAYLLSISGTLDTIGRILAGFVLDLRWIQPLRPVIYNSVLFVIAVVSLATPYMRTFVEFALLFGLYGFLTGVYISQKSVVLVDILGQEKLSSSFGILLAFQGLGVLAGPPLSGLLKDIYGQYDEAFFLGGAAMAGAGILMVVSNVHRIVHDRRRREAATQCGE